MRWIVAGLLGVVGAFVTSPAACLLVFFAGIAPPLPSAGVIVWIIGLAVTPVAGLVGGVVGALLARRKSSSNKALYLGALVGGAIGGIVTGCSIGSLGFPVGQ